MKKIGILTGSRAEYGLLKSLMQKIKDSNQFELQIIVTGMHLMPQFGNTFEQIEEDGFFINEKVDLNHLQDSKMAISNAVSVGIRGISESLVRLKPDLLFILGDRFEAFAGATAAFILNIPIAHISGGDVTEGAIDDGFRHSITKFSYLHFTSTETYRKRVIQLGEEPDRVFNVGSTGIDNVLNMSLLSKNELSKAIDFDLEKPYFLITFHPVTLSVISSEAQFIILLEVLEKHSDYNMIFTYPNADAEGQKIINILEKFKNNKTKNIKVVPNLGTLRYLSAIKYAKVVIGNSSSGIIEVPSFKVPTINIGIRQKGRIKAETVIDCENTADAIEMAIEKAISPSFQSFCQTVENIYGDGHATDKIMNVINNINFDKAIQKHFFDINF